MGKRIKDDEFGFVPDEQPQSKSSSDDFGFVADGPVKKKVSGPALPNIGSDLSPNPNGTPPSQTIDPRVQNAFEVSQRGKHFKNTIETRRKELDTDIKEFAKKKAKSLQGLPDADNVFQQEVANYSNQKVAKVEQELAQLGDDLEKAYAVPYPSKERALPKDAFRDYLYKPQAEDGSFLEGREDAGRLITGGLYDLGKRAVSVFAHDLPASYYENQASNDRTDYENKAAMGQSKAIPVEERIEALKKAGKFRNEADRFLAGVPKTWAEAKGAAGITSYISNALGQGLGQIPLSIATLGGSSFFMEKGDSYNESLQAIGKETDRTPEQVIEDGDDGPARDISDIVGAVNGAMDVVSLGGTLSLFTSPAKKLVSNIAKKEVQKLALKNLGIKGLKITGATVGEVGTEWMQEMNTQVGALVAGGKELEDINLDSIEEGGDIDYGRNNEVALQALFATGPITLAGAVSNKSTKPELEIPEVTAPQAENITEETPAEKSLSPEAKAREEQITPEANEEIQMEATQEIPVAPEEDKTGAVEGSASESAPVTPIDQMTPEEDADNQLAKVTDKIELAKMYMGEARNPTVGNGLDLAIAIGLEGKKVNLQSVIETIGDQRSGEIKPTIKKVYGMSKNPAIGTKIDQIAQDINLTLDAENSTEHVTPEMVWDFVKKYSNGPDQIYHPAKNEVLAKINEQYRKVTGKGMNRGIAKKLIEKSETERKAAFKALGKEAKSMNWFDAQELADLLEVEEQNERNRLSNPLVIELDSLLQNGLTPETLKNTDISKFLDVQIFTHEEYNTIKAIFDYATTAEGSEEINSHIDSINREVNGQIRAVDKIQEVQRRITATERPKREARDLESRVKGFFGEEEYNNSTPEDKRIYLGEDAYNILYPEGKVEPLIKKNNVDNAEPSLGEDAYNEVKSNSNNAQLEELSNEELQLESQRKEEIRAATRPAVKLSLIPAQDLALSKNAVLNKKSHDSIKSRYKSLRNLIECL